MQQAYNEIKKVEVVVRCTAMKGRRVVCFMLQPSLFTKRDWYHQTLDDSDLLRNDKASLVEQMPTL